MNRNPRPIPPKEKWFSIGYVPSALFSAKSELRNLKDYLAIVKKYINEEAEGFRKGVEMEIRQHGLKGEYLQDYYSANEDEFDKWHSSFPNTVLISVLILSCSRFETALTELCKQFELDGDVQISYPWGVVGKQKDTGIHRSKTFLQNNFQIWISDNVGWEFIVDVFKIRDCFVHAGGNINLSKDVFQMRNLINKYSKNGIKENQRHEIELTPPFLNYLIDVMISFWEELFNSFINNAIVGSVYWPS